MLFYIEKFMTSSSLNINYVTRSTCGSMRSWSVRTQHGKKVSSQLTTSMLEFQGNCLRYPMYKTLGRPHSRPGRLEEQTIFCSFSASNHDWSVIQPSHHTDDTPVQFTRTGPTGISASTAKHRLRHMYLKKGRLVGLFSTAAEG